MKLKDLNEDSVRKREPRYVKLRININRQEYLQIRQKADIYCNSNMSAWMRFAALHHIPRSQDLILNETDKHDGRVSGVKRRTSEEHQKKKEEMKQKQAFLYGED